MKGRGSAFEKTATEETAGGIALGIMRRRPYLSITVATLILTIILCGAWQLGRKRELAPLKDEALIWTTIRSVELRKELQQTLGLGEKLAANNPAGWEKTARAIMRDESLLSVFFLMGNEDMILQSSNGVLRAERWRPDADKLLAGYWYERMQKSLLPEIVEYEHVGADEMRAPAFAFLFPLVREGKMVGISGFIKESSKLADLLMDEEGKRKLFVAAGAGRIIVEGKHRDPIFWEKLWRADLGDITMLDKENRLHATDFSLFLPGEGVSAIRNAMRQAEGESFLAPANTHDEKAIYAVVPFDAGLKEPLYLVTLKYPLNMALSDTNLLVTVSILWLAAMFLISIVQVWRAFMGQTKPLNNQELAPQLELSPEIKAQIRKLERSIFYISLLTLLFFVPSLLFMIKPLKEANAAISRGDVEAAKPHIKKMKWICAVSVALGSVVLMFS